MDTILFLKYFSFTGECKTMFLRETWVKLHQFDIVLIMKIKLQKNLQNFVWFPKHMANFYIFNWCSDLMAI